MFLRIQAEALNETGQYVAALSTLEQCIGAIRSHQPDTERHDLKLQV